MMNSGMSPADIAVLSGANKNDGFGMGECGGIIWIFLLLILFGGGNGFGGLGGANANGALTRAELFEGFNNQGVNDGITQLRNGQFGLEQTLCSNFASVNQNINTLGYQMQQCCCETNRSIDAVRYESKSNTCDIVNAIHADGEATRALINANTMQELRDQLQAAQLQLGNLGQTQTLISQLRPFPVPAYPVQSPYVGAYGNCGCNPCGC